MNRRLLAALATTLLAQTALAGDPGSQPPSGGTGLDVRAALGLISRFELRFEHAGLLPAGHPAASLARLGAGPLPAGRADTARADTAWAGTDAVGDLGRVASPYLGLGWGTRFSQALGLRADLGLMYSRPDIRLGVSGAAAEAAADQRRLQDAYDRYRFYPVISAGMSYRF